ncbi:hypothetical protein [Parvibaculum sp.]|uniref:hypothetical protein n=1 Tax=Parvibaculum sp. TaxID=2024848 RepID=UPI001D5BA01A|nr:hypothetical protein [Parvibaculum sp.]MBX3489184.1 hypothetical protein [Parvibaculum sp.]
MFRIVPLTPIFRRGSPKPAGKHRKAATGRQPRNRAHFGIIALLPCAVPGCGAHPVHVAHIRFACVLEGAAHTGKGMKPEDWRVLPLCPTHHTEGPDAQHRMNEEVFWTSHGINPYALARALWNLSGSIEAMRFLVTHAPQVFPARRDR